MRAFGRLIIIFVALTCGLAHAQVAPNSAQYQPAWVMSPYGFNPTSDCYWAKSLYYGNCTLTVSRASIGTYSDSFGNWYQAANNVARIGYGTGVWVEEARTNVALYNNAITSGNWTISGTVLTGVQTSPDRGTNASLISEDMATDTKRIISTDSTSITYGQTWTISIFAKYTNSLRYIQLTFPLGSFGTSQYATFDLLNGIIVAGSTTGGTANIIPYVNGWYRLVWTATATITASAQTTATIGPTNGSNTRGPSYLGTGLSALIWSPQVELNPSINSSVASATVNAGGTLYTPSSSGTVTWSGSGCSTNPVLNVTTSVAGVINAVTSVATAGSCTTFPSSSATTWTDGTGLGTGSGASFNLVPVNNAAQGFATSPIPTTNAAVTRAADVITYTSPGTFCPGGYSMVAWGNPFAPITYTVFQFAGAASDGTTNNIADLARSTIGNWELGVTVSGAANAVGNTSSWGQSSAGKLAASIMPGAQNVVYNGGAPATGALSAPSGGLTHFNLGSRSDGTRFWNGTIARTTLFNCTVLPAAALQAVTNPNLWNFLLRRDVLPDAGNDNRPMWLEYVA